MGTRSWGVHWYQVSCSCRLVKLSAQAVKHGMLLKRSMGQHSSSAGTLAS
jgi:hypothetical protein